MLSVSRSFSGIPAIIAIYLLTGSPLCGESLRTDWRFFTASDGLAESWCSYITLGPDDKVWVSHGLINEISWLDGWPTEDGKFVHTMPNPGPDLEVYESRSGQLWSVYSNGIQLFKDGAWVQYPVEEIDNPYEPDVIIRSLTPFAPGEENELYYLLPNRLMKYNVADKRNEIIIQAAEVGFGKFNDMIPARLGGVWITCDKGIVRYGPVADPAEFHWRKFSPGFSGLGNFQKPVEGATGELFVVAEQHPGSASNVLLYFNGGHWRILSDHVGQIEKGWPGLDGSYWVLKQDNSLVHVKNGREDLEKRTGILAATIRDVAVGSNGVFWLTTSHGVARYTPPIWRAPIEVEDIETWVHAIQEDPQGRLWFACADRILLCDNGKWKSYTLPESVKSQPFSTQSFCCLPNGLLLIGTLPYRNNIFAFDPRKESFLEIPYHNPGRAAKENDRRIGLLAQYRNGGIIVETRKNQEPSGFSLEIFDGKTFRTVLDQDGNLELGNPRYVLETESGDLWIAGQSGGGAVLTRGGEFKVMELDPEYGDNGVFAICEVEPGKIWIGGRDYILQFDGSRWTEVRSGMASVRSITKSRDGSIRIVSGTGIHRFFQGTWTTNNELDGLPNSGAFCIFEDSRGTIWAGTINGLSRYHPEADASPPRTLISATENLKEYSPGGEVRLIFSGLDKWNQTNHDRLLFSYRLDDGEWSEYRPGHVAVFEKLLYGRHIFAVRAMDLNLNFDPVPKDFSFTVLLPWYREYGFQVVVGIGGIVILILLGVAIHRHVMLEKLVIERTEDLRTANEKLEDNIVELKQAEEKLKWEHANLEQALEYKSLLAEVASRLNSVERFEKVIDEVLDLIARRMEIDSVCFLCQLNSEFTSSFRKRRQIAGDQDHSRGSSIPCQCWSWSEIFSLMAGSKDLGSSSTGKEINLQEGWFNADRQRTISVMPVLIDSEPVGFLCYCQGGELKWQPAEIEMFKAVSDIISNAWERQRQSQARLEAEKKQADALRMADKASRMASIGVIAAGITHEIMQPLNDIKVTADSVLIWNEKNKGNLPTKYREWLGSISGSVNRISRIIEQMRSYWALPNESRISAIDLNGSVANALSLIKRQLDSHGIELVVTEHARSTSVNGNQVNMEQVVLNLVVNAMHALDSSGRSDKRIEIVIDRIDGKAVMEVRDNGPGLPKGVGTKLFDPFYSTKKREEGMGLGLAIVKRFVEGFGGRVEAGNNTDGGARFTVEIPLSS